MDANRYVEMTEIVKRVRAEAYKKGKEDALEELSKNLYHKAFEVTSDMSRWDSGLWIRYKLFENTVDEMLKEQTDDK